MTRPRFQVLDLLRGFLFLNMVTYHALYDWVFLFQHNVPFMYQYRAYIWQQAVCSGFILLAGCCCTLSRKPAERGLRVLLCGMLVTVVTVLFTPEEQILFGILHFIGTAYLLTALLQPLLRNIPAVPALPVLACLFLFIRGIYYGHFGIWDHVLIPLPDSWYQYPPLFLIGLPSKSFFSSDYFPVIPWLFLFWCGYFGGPLLLRSSLMARIQSWHIAPLNWVGRHTLLLYMLHQPVVFGAMTVLSAIL